MTGELSSVYGPFRSRVKRDKTKGTADLPGGPREYRPIVRSAQAQRLRTFSDSSNTARLAISNSSCTRSSSRTTCQLNCWAN